MSPQIWFKNNYKKDLLKSAWHILHNKNPFSRYTTQSIDSSNDYNKQWADSCTTDNDAKINGGLSSFEYFRILI